MQKVKIKKNDEVLVTHGRDRGVLLRRGLSLRDRLSNLKLVCPECGRPSRVGRKRLEDGSGVRVCKSCGATFN